MACGYRVISIMVYGCLLLPWIGCGKPRTCPSRLSKETTGYDHFFYPKLA